MLQSPSDHCRPLNPLSPVSSAGDEPQTITSSQLVWFLNGASLHTPTEAECVQIAEATGSRVGSEGLAPGTRCGRPSIVGGGSKPALCPPHWGPPAPPRCPLWRWPPAPHGPAGPHGCPIAAVPTVRPPSLCSPRAMPLQQPLCFPGFSCSLGSRAPCPRARARALAGSTAAAPPKAGSALSKGPSGFPSQARPLGPVSGALRGSCPP